MDENRWHVKDFAATGEGILPPALKTQRSMGNFGCQDALNRQQLNWGICLCNDEFCKRLLS